ncbi:MAG TPA: hypothetical protein PKO41_03395 [Dokdonella sp.]|uniref:hypothetical protein n=1 Tax=Dokdonella sp. TaxID=2291710 RepID=UPI0025B7DBFA|nr:hypothetical protein [Dokdonella sp.]HNR91451.1 hypothetical protein [Dokdonella sp.]
MSNSITRIERVEASAGRAFDFAVPLPGFVGFAGAGFVSMTGAGASVSSRIHGGIASAALRVDTGFAGGAGRGGVLRTSMAGAGFGAGGVGGATTGARGAAAGRGGGGADCGVVAGRGGVAAG